MQEAKAKSRLGGVLLRVIVLWHVFATIVWSLPNPPAGLLAQDAKPIGTDVVLVWNYQYLKSNSIIDGYIQRLGLWQAWDMFAPDPASVDYWMDAEAVFKDGSTMIYAYPRIKNLPIPLKMVKERYRKFLERTHIESSSRYWPRIAQRLALEIFRQTDKVPRLVRLRRHFRFILPPTEKTPDGYQMYMFYEHQVDADTVMREAKE